MVWCASQARKRRVTRFWLVPLSCRGYAGATAGNPPTPLCKRGAGGISWAYPGLLRNEVIFGHILRHKNTQFGATNADDVAFLQTIV